MTPKIPDNPAFFAMKASEGTWKPFRHLNLIIELKELESLRLTQPPQKRIHNKYFHSLIDFLL